ncbi:hypothetical protein DFH06DRAFT_1145617 [Mycena polygramma]|nr:hypothetical protein DFH06DRAFT_1145617 [Mycena polygramma]
MHPQGVNSATFTAAPLDGSLTFPQLLDRQLAQSPRHIAYIYDAPDGKITRISFAQYIGTVYAATGQILRDIPTRREGTVVGILAVAALTKVQTLSRIDYCAGMMVAAIMRAGLIPFCISPRNAAAGVANLLQRVGAAALYVSPDMKPILTDALENYGKPLSVFEVLTFEGLQEALVESSETLPVLSAAPADSTGSISIFSKPIYWSHKMILQAALAPWSDDEDLCGQSMGAQTLPTFHAIGIFLGIWPFSAGITIAVLRPQTPPIPAGILASKPDRVLSTPAFIERWSEDPAGLKAMQALKKLSYSGAPMNKRVGDALVAKGVALCSVYGTMETGLLTSVFPCHAGKDWEYFFVRKEFNPVRVPEEDGSGLYTHTYLVDPTFATSYTNTEINGRPGCSISDLLEHHPGNSDLHRIYGRKDDLIAFSTAAKMNPVPIEAQINRNPLVDAALVFGHGRLHPGMLIQLKEEFLADLLDEKKKSNIEDSLW